LLGDVVLQDRDAELSLHAFERGPRSLVRLDRGQLAWSLAEGLMFVLDPVVQSVPSEAAYGAIPQVAVVALAWSRAERLARPVRISSQLSSHEFLREGIALVARLRDCLLKRRSLRADLVRVTDFAHEPVPQGPHGCQLCPQTVHRTLKVVALRAVRVACAWQLRSWRNRLDAPGQVFFMYD
jgi:hypothetical protein